MSYGFVLGVIVLKVFTEFWALKVLCQRQHYCFEGKYQSYSFEGIGSVTERARAQPGRKLSYAASCLVGSQIFASLLSSFLLRLFSCWFTDLCLLRCCSVGPKMPGAVLTPRSSLASYYSFLLSCLSSHIWFNLFIPVPPLFLVLDFFFTEDQHAFFQTFFEGSA